MSSATPFRIFRTTAFKLLTVYLVVFALFAVGVLGYIAVQTNILFGQNLREQLDQETSGLANMYRRGGMRALVRSIDRRSRMPGSNLYLVVDPQGRMLAGNIPNLSESLLSTPGTIQFEYEPEREDTSVQPSPDPGSDHADHDEEDDPRGFGWHMRSGKVHAVARVFIHPEGFRILVGRDVREHEAFRAIIGRAFVWSIVLVLFLGVAGWYYVSRRVLRRIDVVSATSQRIMAGDLSERIPLEGTRDEFDRLAESLNAMLERIELLMRGLKEVSDNIAHDLKTPLTRMRNRIEASLRNDPDTEQDREALEAVIAESDQLIRTFNALLMIARVEAGAKGQAFSVAEPVPVLRDVVDLYEAVAEEKGVTLALGGIEAAPVRMNRELLSQALANLLDNAIKYAAASDKPQVHASLAVEEGRVRFIVADNGPGIPAEDRERVRERFVRLEKSRSEPGSGLGLSLVAAVAELHDGKLTLEDNAPGLRVILELPAATGGASA